MKMNKKILCTLGPASLNEYTIKRLDELGVDLFRINLSHTKLEELQSIINYIKDNTMVPICIDTEGAQIRNGEIKNGSIILNEHNLINVVKEKVIGNKSQFNLYPDYIFEKLEREDFLSIDFDSVLLQVLEKKNNFLKMRIVNGGEMGQNKAVSLNRPIEMPPLTNKDKKAIKIGREMGINHFALSFANFPEDVDLIKSYSGERAYIISKIECVNGVKNLEKIISRSDAILIDRGDLSREFPIERIPSLQKRIIAKCNIENKEVYVATNLLETMIESGTPTRAEVNDVYTTLKDGANGLVLAAETAIGSNPVACVNMIVKLIYSFENDLNTEKLGFYHDKPNSLLVEPYGGHLVNNFEENLSSKVKNLKKIKLSNSELLDCEMISNGTFSPISGFMDERTLKSVLDSNCLPNSLVWTMPIILQLNPEYLTNLKIGQNICLCDDLGKTYFILEISDIYRIDLSYVAKKWFETNSKNHPGVKKLMNKGDHCIAGSILMVKKFSSQKNIFHFSPKDTRFLFDHKGWQKVISFQTKYPALRLHEFIQLSSIKNYLADGLFITSPVRLIETDDFLPEEILESYRILIEEGIYPKRTVILGNLLSRPRFCNHREIVFDMICKKNMGCSHIVVGNDNLKNIKRLKTSKENKKILEIGSEIGITPIFLDRIFNLYSNSFEKEFSNIRIKELLSSFELRTALLDEDKLPEYYIRGVVQDNLKISLKK